MMSVWLSDMISSLDEKHGMCAGSNMTKKGKKERDVIEFVQ